LVAAYQYRGRLSAVITGVQYVREAECQCITVSHPSRLYITDDYAVTHNTILLLSRAFYLWEAFNLKVLFFSMEMTLPSILERAAAMQARVPLDYMKHGLFPNLKVDFKKQLIDKLDQGAKAKNMFNFVDGNLAVTNDDLLRI
jgi:replicative DNA helicase